MDNYIVNDGKNEVIDVDGVKYSRLCLRTHVITDKDVIVGNYRSLGGTVDFPVYVNKNSSV